MQPWPMHPRPLPGEALSSWVRRLATDNVCSLRTLFAHGLEQEDFTDGQLDLDPPEALLWALSERTGVPVDRIRGMTVRGWTPLLIDQLKSSRELARTYIGQFSVLFEPGRALPAVPPSTWVPWHASRRYANPLGCRYCLAYGDHKYFRLHWRMPFVMTCPSHRKWLEPVKPSPRNRGYHCDGDERKSEPPQSLMALDELTLQAVGQGFVLMQHRRLHGGVWMRLLRALVNEVTSETLIAHASERDVLRRVWKHAGFKRMKGKLRGHMFESHTHPQQVRVLRAAAAAVDMIQNGLLHAYGPDAHLLRGRPLTVTAMRNRLASPSEEAERHLSNVRSAIGMVSSAQVNERLASMIRNHLVKAIGDEADAAYIDALLYLAQVPVPGLADEAIDTRAA